MNRAFVLSLILLQSAASVASAAGTHPAAAAKAGVSGGDGSADGCDVLVVGGGAAGIAAAGQAGRAGAKTILIEQGFQVGGNMTSGCVNLPGLFHAYGRQVVSGFGWETVSNTLEVTGDKFPPYREWRTQPHWVIQPHVYIPIYVAICEEMLRGAGVTIRYYSSPAALAREGDSWKVTVHSGGDVRIIRAKEIVDCTGAGTVAKMAGARLMDADERSPGAFRFFAEGVPPRKDWNVPAMQKAYREAIADGSLKVNDTRADIFGFTRFTGLLTNYIDTEGEGTDGRGDVNMRGRASMLRLYRFLKKLPGFEKFQIKSCAAETGVRETTRVKGDYVITGDDYVTGRVWPDSLCYVFYPVDLHSKTGGVQPKPLAEGVVPTVPLRALLPEGVDHMLVAGRCLSADRLAMSAIRVQGACMSTGQAAGEAAALAAKTGVSPRRLDVARIKAGLRARGCIVP